MFGLRFDCRGCSEPDLPGSCMSIRGSFDEPCGLNVWSDFAP